MDPFKTHVNVVYAVFITAKRKVIPKAYLIAESREHIRSHAHQSQKIKSTPQHWATKDKGLLK